MSHVTTHIADPGAGVAEDHHGGAVVVIHQGPEVTAGAHLRRRDWLGHNHQMLRLTYHRPLGHNILPGVGVALNMKYITVDDQLSVEWFNR